jgi:hypothetical protein
MESNNRYERGVATLAALLNYWLNRGGISHDQMTALANWALGERTTLDGGVVSRLRNGKQTRGAGLAHLDALAAANRAIWSWQVQGQQETLKELGPFTGWGVTTELLDDACWLPRPEQPEQPLTLGDWAELLMGRLTPDYLNGQISLGQASRMNESLAQLLDDLAADRGWGPREAIRQYLEAYPAQDVGRRQRLRDLLMGEPLTQPELELEMAALAEMLRRVRGLERFTPGELQGELLSDRR